MNGENTCFPILKSKVDARKRAEVMFEFRNFMQNLPNMEQP